MIIDTIIDIKRKNFKGALNYLRTKGDCQKKELAVEMNLSFATVSSMVNDMMQIGLVEEVQKDQKLVGRAPKAFALCPNRYVMVVADIHHVQIDQCVRLTIVNLCSQMLATKSVMCSETNGIDGFMDEMVCGYREFLSEAGFKEENVIGVSIVTRGIFDSQTECVVGTFHKLILNQPIGKMLNERIHKPIWVGNDADLAAFEMACQLRVNHLVYLYCKNGLGIGVVTNGSTLAGANGYSPEISHVPYGVLDEECDYCHHRDCLQTDVARKGFLRKYLGYSVANEADEKTAWAAFIESVEREEPKALQVVNENAHILGRVCALVAAVLRPAVFMMGGMPQALFEHIRPVIENEMNTRERHANPVEIRMDPDFQRTAALGAAETLYLRWNPDLDLLIKTSVGSES